jgi:hypothetical protein
VVEGAFIEDEGCRLGQPFLFALLLDESGAALTASASSFILHFDPAVQDRI